MHRAVTGAVCLQGHVVSIPGCGYLHADSQGPGACSLWKACDEVGHRIRYPTSCGLFFHTWYLIFLIYHSHLKTTFTVWVYSRSLRPTAQMDGDVRCEEWALRSDTSTSVLANLQDPAASWPPKVHHSLALPTPMWLNRIWCLHIVELLLFLTNNSTCPRKYRWKWRVILGYLIL